jgi:hypothetical protein
MKNENTHTTEQDAFLTIGFVTQLILNKLRVQAQLTDVDKEKDSERSGHRDGADRSEENSEQHRAYVDRRLKDIRAMEDRMRGKGKQI